MNSSSSAAATQSQRSSILRRIREELEAMQVELPREIEPASHLTEDLGLTSLDAVDLVLALEDAFEIELEDDDVAEFETVDDVIDAVERQQRGGGDGDDAAGE